MATIRQEINILNEILTAASGASKTSEATVQLTTTSYDGTVSYYFEIVGDTSLSLSVPITLRRAGTTTDDATCTIPVLTTAYTRVRSAAFTPPAGSTEYVVFIPATVGATKNVKSAKIIIIQTGTITKTETQIEVGAKETTLSTTFANLVAYKYFLYQAAQWDGSVTVNFEATISTPSSKTVSQSQLKAGGVAVASSAVSTTSTTGARVRSGAITLSDGSAYYTDILSASSKTVMTIWNAKVIITQTSMTKCQPMYLLQNLAGAGTGLQAYQTLYDSTEWNAGSGTLTFKHFFNTTGTAGSTVKLTDITASADVTNSSVADAADGLGQVYGLSSAMTMPATGHEIDNNNVTLGAGASTFNQSAILVQVVIAAASDTLFAQGVM